MSLNDQSNSASGGSVGSGIALTLLLHIAALVLAIGAAVTLQGGPFAIPLIAFLLIGVSQLVYMVPAVIIAHVRGRRGIAKGLIIGASVTFVLNTACWGLLTVSGTL